MVTRPNLRAVLRTLFSWHHGPAAEIVGIGNFCAALGVGALAFVALDLSLALAAVAAAVTFVLLVLCLLHPYTFWISALAGGLSISVVPALVLGSLGAVVGNVAIWIGAGLGLAAGVTLAIRGYVRFLRDAGRR